MSSFGEGPPKIKPNPLPKLLRINTSVYPFRLTMAQLLGVEPILEYERSDPNREDD